MKRCRMAVPDNWKGEVTTFVNRAPHETARAEPAVYALPPSVPVGESAVIA